MPDPSDLVALQAGAAAYTAGQPIVACPYSPKTEGRHVTLWLRGYNDARQRAGKLPAG